MDDPWYGDDSAFDQTYAEVVAAADGVVDHVRRELGRPEPLLRSVRYASLAERSPLTAGNLRRVGPVRGWEAHDGVVGNTAAHAA